MRATSSELAIWRQRIGDREREHRSRGSIEHEVFGALEAERWHALDYEARVRELAADRREMDPTGVIARLQGIPRHSVVSITRILGRWRE
jgi:hypothetical protein